MTAARPIRLVLAGNNAIVLACLEQLFALEENFAVIARCGKGGDVLGTLHASRPDILLLDLPPSFREGLALLSKIKEAALPTRVIFLAETPAEGELAHAIRLGVRGIVPKEVAPHLLAQCIRNIHAGGVWLRGTSVSFPAISRPAASGRGGALTPREIEIVRLICGGLGNRQVAKRLGIGEATVKTHVHQIYDKLRLRDRLQLGLYGREKGLTSTNRPDTSH
jgi:DNA-binding NarL/FixJ family response regulator